MAEWDGLISTRALGSPLYVLCFPPLLLAVRASLCHQNALPGCLCSNDIFDASNIFLDDPVAFGFIIAGIINIMILIPAKFLNNDTMHSAWPGFFGRPACVHIVLRGLAYLAAARRYATVPWLIVVFALEKFYVLVGAYALMQVKSESSFDQMLVRHFEIAEPSQVQPHGFGLVDFAFFVFFCWAAYSSLFNCVPAMVPACQ
eukprot:TRINITY_DN1598_c0_g1_i2.p1 TRINITY_DN1598_c0_g1~~TRINITY_DN1598_c0_g1_i2.p1  ORF type:complete len:202 (+),score=35.41 TRINITY_DN1598_c0_g1_i2:214-819(+)